MANIGLSQPYYSTYTESSGTITYGTAKKLGKATTVDLSIDNKDPEKLYADNGVAETLSLFSSGTVTLGIDELDLATAAEILGLSAPSSSGGITFTADAVAPYVGLGFIVKKIKAGTIKYRAIAFFTAQFKPVDFSVNTQGETVEFQTPELEATIMKDDSSTPQWSWWEDFDTESAALSALQAKI